MKKFQFKLQKLLDIREAKEREIQNELAQVVGLQNIERTRQADLNNMINREKDIYRKKMTAGTYSVQEAVMFERFVDNSLRAIEAAEQKIRELEPKAREIRDRLLVASREKKVVEKLKERQLEEYNYEINREIMKENDDINQNLFNRRMILEEQ